MRNSIWRWAMRGIAREIPVRAQWRTSRQSGGSRHRRAPTGILESRFTNPVSRRLRAPHWGERFKWRQRTPWLRLGGVCLLRTLAQRRGRAQQFPGSPRTDPCFAAAPGNLARLLAAKGDMAQAVYYFDKAARLQP